MQFYTHILNTIYFGHWLKEMSCAVCTVYDVPVETLTFIIVVNVMDKKNIKSQKCSNFDLNLGCSCKINKYIKMKFRR